MALRQALEMGEDVDHRMHKPRQVFVDQDAVVLKSVEVVDEGRVRLDHQIAQSAVAAVAH